MAKKSGPLMKVIDVVIGLLVAIALVNWGTVYWFDLNLVELITFNIGWLAGTVYTLVSVVGLLWLISGIVRLLSR